MLASYHHGHNPPESCCQHSCETLWILHWLVYWESVLHILVSVTIVWNFASKIHKHFLRLPAQNVVLLPFRYYYCGSPARTSDVFLYHFCTNPQQPPEARKKVRNAIIGWPFTETKPPHINIGGVSVRISAAAVISQSMPRKRTPELQICLWS